MPITFEEIVIIIINLIIATGLVQMLMMKMMIMVSMQTMKTLLIQHMIGVIRKVTTGTFHHISQKNFAAEIISVLTLIDVSLTFQPL